MLLHTDRLARSLHSQRTRSLRDSARARRHARTVQAARQPGRPAPVRRLIGRSIVRIGERIAKTELDRE
jgi:hypothetical protein